MQVLTRWHRLPESNRHRGKERCQENLCPSGAAYPGFVPGVKSMALINVPVIGCILQLLILGLGNGAVRSGSVLLTYPAWSQHRS